MNVFEELIEELKEENLLEETVIESHSIEENGRKAVNNGFSGQSVESANFEEFNDEASLEEEDFPSDLDDLSVDDSSLIGEIYDEEIPVPASIAAEIPVAETAPQIAAAADEKPQKAAEPVDETEFYRKRAIDEVSCLQMVEHVFSGVEREQMKVTPKPYDDLKVQIALHDFLQVSKNTKSAEHAKSEFQLMQETESWYSALSQRDKYISVANLRRFCETTRPVLSAQALMALARFYRNSPYTEQVRSKFDLVITRLFSKDIGNEQREMIYSREELIENLTSLYADWASIPLYAAADEDDNSEVLIATLKFEDFMLEAGKADSLNELLKTDFFNLLHSFKESTHENFFAPLVTATAIESNVKIGNCYIDLIKREQGKAGHEKLEEEYGFLLDQVISEAAGKTLVLVELLHRKFENLTPTFSEEVESKIYELNEEAASQPKSKREAKKAKPQKAGFLSFQFNKGLMLATVLIVLASVSLYVWVEYYSAGSEKPSQSNVKKVNLDNSSLKDYVRDARISKDTFFAIVQSSWDNSTQEKKEEVLKKLQAIGAEKGLSKVNLLSKDGKIVGYASAENVVTY